MAFTRQVLDNPATGERITFVKTAADTRGELLAFDLELTPDGHVPGAHIHPFQEEHFTVSEGTMRFRKGLRVVTAHAGDSVVVAPGTIHRFENVGDGPARVRVEVRPALRMEDLLETSTALARAGSTNSKGMPRPLELAVFMAEFDDEVRAPFAHRVVRAVMSPLVWLARRRDVHIGYGRPRRHAVAEA